METTKPFDEFDLAGKVAIVTGAGRGMGAHIAKALAKYGADLVICSRTVAELESVAEEVRRFGREAFIRQIDLTQVQETKKMVDEAMKRYGHIDILVNNAGINIPQKAEEVTEEAWDQVHGINLKGLFFCAQAVGKVMIKQKSGKIINVSSQAGSVGIPLRSAYCSSKGGVNLLTKVLAVEWAPYNINVNAISPTFVEGPFTKPMFENVAFKNYVLGSIPLGRIGQPTDVIGGVIYLASPAADLVTGHILLIDGGWTAQ